MFRGIEGDPPKKAKKHKRPIKLVLLDSSLSAGSIDTLDDMSSGPQLSPTERFARETERSDI